MRAFFPMPRLGHVTSNMAESINAWLQEQRSQPPLRFFLDTLRKINELFNEMRLNYEKMNRDDIEPATFASIIHNTEDGRRLECFNVFGMKFQVQSRVAGGTLRDVDLECRECSCKQFQDLRCPCVHACSAALFSGVRIPSLCIPERRVGSLQMVYAEGIVLADMENVRSQVLAFPLVQRLPGRPRIKRARHQEEDRPRRVAFCSFCGRRGHNIRTCPENYA